MKKRIFIQFLSLFCTLAVLVSGVAGRYAHHETYPKTAKANNKQEKQSEKTKISEKLPFDAIVTAGLQVDFQKFIFTPFVALCFETPTKIRFAQVSITLLSFYHILFRSSIQVNAP